MQIENAIEISLLAQTVYGDAAVRLRALASDRFVLIVKDGDLLAIESGTHRGSEVAEERLEAVESAGAWVVEAVIGDWLAWLVEMLPTRDGGEIEVEYSQRFFPYICSAIRGRLSVEGGTVGGFVVRLEGGGRPLRHHDYNVVDDNQVEAAAKISRLTDGWIWRFRWEGTSGPTLVAFHLPIAIGAPTLASLVGIAAYSVLISLVGLAVAAAVAPLYIVVGLLLASVGALLARWATTDRPHHLTLLVGIYSIAASLMVVWAGAVELGEWWLLTGVAPTAFVLFLLRMNAYFEAVGALPPWLARRWGRLSERLHDARTDVRERFRNEWRRSGIRREWRPGGRATRRYLDELRQSDRHDPCDPNDAGDE